MIEVTPFPKTFQAQHWVSNEILFVGPPPPATSVAQRHAGLDEDDQRLLFFLETKGMAAVNGL